MKRQALSAKGIPWWALLHYSRLLLTFGAMAMTLATSQIVFHHIPWPAIAIAGLGTHVVYSTDNLLDWRHERHLLHEILPYRRAYLIWYHVTVPLSLIIILLITVKRGSDFGLLLGGLVLVSALIIFIARQPQRWLDQAVYYWTERLLVTLTWALVVVLVPMWYARQMWSLQVGLALAFIWMLSWVMGVVWRFTSVTAVYQQINLHYQPPTNETKIIRIMLAVSFIAFLQAIIDAVVGFFPAIHLSIALVPAFCVAFLWKWPASYQAPLVYCSLFISLLIATLLMATGLHLWAG